MSDRKIGTKVYANGIPGVIRDFRCAPPQPYGCDGEWDGESMIGVEITRQVPDTYIDWYKDEELSHRPPPKPCEFCGTMLTFGYIANDPENGPAGYHCDRSRCQNAEQAVHDAAMLDADYEEMIEQHENMYPTNTCSEPDCEEDDTFLDATGSPICGWCLLKEHNKTIRPQAVRLEQLLEELEQLFLTRDKNPQLGNPD